MLNRRGGIECDFTVARLGEERFSIVTGTAFGNHDREWIRRHLPADGGVADPRRHLALGLLRDLGTAGARRARAADPGGPRQRGLPLHEPARDRRSATSRCGRCGSPTSASSAGSSTARPSTASACGGRSGRRASRTASSPAATGRSTRCGSRRATGSGAPTSRPTRPPYEGGVGFCVKLDKEGGFIGREALVEARERGPRGRLCCLVLEDPRSVALGNEPVRVGGEIGGRVTTGGYGYTVERSIAYAYLPPEQRRAGHRGRGRDLRRVGRRARSPTSRSSTRRASGSAPERAQRGAERLDGRQEAGEDVLGALDVVAHQLTAPAPSPARMSSTSRRCWSLERPRTSSGWAIARSGRSSAPAPRSSR